MPIFYVLPKMTSCSLFNLNIISVAAPGIPFFEWCNLIIILLLLLLDVPTNSQDAVAAAPCKSASATVYRPSKAEAGGQAKKTS